MNAINNVLSYILSFKFYQLGDILDETIIDCTPIYTFHTINGTLFNLRKPLIYYNGNTYWYHNYFNTIDNKYYSIEFNKDRKILRIREM